MMGSMKTCIDLSKTRRDKCQGKKSAAKIVSAEPVLSFISAVTRGLKI